MPKKFRFDHLRIKSSEHERLLRWSLSLHEIGALCFGSGNSILHVARVPNVLKSKEYFEWDWEERARAIVSANRLRLRLVAEVHSHPLPGQLPHPSKSDTKYFEKGRPHIICFPPLGIMRCWMMCRELSDTVNSEIEILIV